MANLAHAYICTYFYLEQMNCMLSGAPPEQEMQQDENIVHQQKLFFQRNGKSHVLVNTKLW